MRTVSFVTQLALAAGGLCAGPAQPFTNANFEAGNVGFYSEYEFSDFNSAESQFTVRNDPQNWNLEFINFGDHTTGAGKTLVVNGATSGNPATWRQTISVEPNTAYRFQTWVGSAVGGGPTNLILMIDRLQVGPSYVPPNGTSSWVLWEQPWTSSAKATCTFEIINANTSRYPNDFYMDDLDL